MNACITCALRRPRNRQTNRPNCASWNEEQFSTLGSQLEQRLSSQQNQGDNQHHNDGANANAGRGTERRHVALEQVLLAFSLKALATASLAI
jgi:hypothetical protein